MNVVPCKELMLQCAVDDVSVVFVYLIIGPAGSHPV